MFIFSACFNKLLLFCKLLRATRAFETTLPSKETTCDAMRTRSFWNIVSLFLRYE